MRCGWRAKQAKLNYFGKRKEGKKRYLNGGDSGGTLLIRSPRAGGCASGRFSRRPAERFEHKLGVRGQLDDHPHGRSSSPTSRLFDQRSI
jgi:hypothetical protein